MLHAVDSNPRQLSLGRDDVFNLGELVQLLRCCWRERPQSLDVFILGERHPHYDYVGPLGADVDERPGQGLCLVAAAGTEDDVHEHVAADVVHVGLFDVDIGSGDGDYGAGGGEVAVVLVRWWGSDAESKGGNRPLVGTNLIITCLKIIFKVDKV